MAPVNRGPRLELNKYGIWEIRWSEDRRSMRKSTGCTDRAGAEQALAAFLQGRAARSPGMALTVGQALDDYLREHVEHGPVVDKERQRDIIANLRPFFGDKACRDVTPADVLEYQRQRKAGKVGARAARSAGTWRRELNTLTAALNHAVRARRLPAGDAPYIPLPPAPGAKDFWLTEAEVGQLLAACDAEDARLVEGDRGALFIRIALATAARRRSIETLTWAQVDLQARLIHYNPPGRRQTAKRRVAVPISDDLLPHLQRAHEHRRGDWVLRTDRAITKRLEAVCRRAYDATGNSRFLLVTPHTLRHTWATLAARAGVSMFEIAGVLGDSLATVQRNYLHHSPDHLRGAVNFMSGKATVAALSHPAAPDRGAQTQDLRATAPDTSQQDRPKPQVRAW